ncbi:unnamed protein product [Urochloa humidicola]
MAGRDVTVNVEWLLRRLMQPEEDAVAREDQHRITQQTTTACRACRVRIPNPDSYTPGLVAIGLLRTPDTTSAGSAWETGSRWPIWTASSPAATATTTIIQGYVHARAGGPRNVRR